MTDPTDERTGDGSLTDDGAPDGSATDDASIADRTDRLEAIVEQLEDGEVSLERAHELHEEGRELLESLREDLDFDGGSVKVRE